MTASPPPFSVEELTVSRGRRRLIEGLSFALAPGQRALVAGPNGAGKTTLLRVLAGLAPAASGRVRWSDTRIDRLLPEQRADIVYRGHLDGLKKELSVRENLEFYRALRGTGGGDLASVLDELSLAEVSERPLRYLSAGQRRRAALAALKLGEAKLWLLDEPTTNLDVDGRHLVARWVGEHVAGGGMAIVATHRPDEFATSGAYWIEL